MSLIIPANSASAAGGYAVDNSCRFDGSTSKLVKSQSAGNRDLWTYSVWIKWSAITTTTTTFFASSDGSNLYAYIGIQSYKIRFLDYNSGNQTNLITNRLFRDPSAWYHIVLAYDSAQGTDSNRVKLYVNGVQETSFSTETYPSSGLDSAVNVNSSNFIISSNQEQSSGSMWNGYMAESCFIDGQALAADQFGEFDSDSGIWKPKNVSGLTFGTNGFYLDFEDSANLGNDANGGTDFTATGLAAIDQTTDTCTNNFATMNPLDNFYAGSTFSEGNCRVVTGSSPQTWNTSTFGLNSGKWYMEATIIDGGSGGSTLIGIADRPTVSATAELGELATTYAYLSSGNFRTNNTNTSNGVSSVDGDIIGIALDLDSAQNTISYYKNNTLIVAAQNITAPVSGNYFIASGVWLDNDTGTTDHNFGNPVVAHSSAANDENGYGSFEFAPPSGFLAICTKNLAEYG